MSDAPRFALSKAEGELVRRLPARVGYVGTVNFRGPRGRRYRGVRTKVFVSLDSALGGIAEIRSKQYRNGAFPTSDDVYAVDHLGRIVEDA